MSTFLYVFIPSNEDENLRELVGDVHGGLENDDVQLSAKKHLNIDMVNICSLGLPTVATNYIGVSMYSHCDGKECGLAINSRATEIVQACGHLSTIIYGDAFLSRYYDNEDEPWRRLDMKLSEAHISSEWIEQVARMNKGKNMSTYTTGGTLQQLLSNSLNAQVSSPPTTIETASNVNDIVQWSQTSDEVEVIFFLDVPEYFRFKWPFRLRSKLKMLK